MTQRYSRQQILAEIGEAGQKRLSAASILVVGAGGLGCPALQYLAGAGVGTLGIVDDDVVDISNLQRQILYTTEDAGKQKAPAARQRLLQLNPDITIHAHAERLTADNAPGLFSAYDIILDGTDNFAAKFLINDAAVLAGKPVVYGAMQGFEGQVSVFDAVRGPCYRCLHPQPPQETILNCAEAGAIGALAGIVGAAQAMEALKLIVGHASFKPLIGTLWLIDARTMETHTLTIPKRKECPLCSKPRAEITLQNSSPVCFASAAAEVDAGAAKNAVMIDIREFSEREKGHITGDRHLPFSLLQRNINAFTPPESGTRCVLYCQTGARSRKAAEALLTAGFSDIFSLKGGFDAWRSGGQ